MQHWALGHRQHVRVLKGIWMYSAELKYRLSCLKSPRALAELLANYLTVAFISNIVRTISDLFHMSLVRKKERFFRLEENKINQQEFQRFQVSQSLSNGFLLIWSSALHMDLGDLHIRGRRTKAQLLTFLKLYSDNSLFLPQAKQG